MERATELRVIEGDEAVHVVPGKAFGAQRDAGLIRNIAVKCTIAE